MNKPKSPCPRYCDKRAVGCRKSCDAWQRYEAEKAAWYHQNEIEREAAAAASSVIHVGYVRTLSKNQRGRAKRMGWKQ